MQLQKRTPEEALIYQSQKLAKALRRIKTLEYARWALFSAGELKLITEGLSGLALLSAPPGKISALLAILENLNTFLNDHSSSPRAG
jgi:hypothetical protein